MVALLLFSGGGVFSIYEGIHKLQATGEELGTVWLGFAILGFSIAIEGWATISNIKELNKRRGSKPLFRYLRETKDSDLVVVFGENSAAVLGLALAMGSLFIAWQTGDARWDAVGSLAIGVVLIAVAIFLAVEVKSLLVGESADPEIESAVREAVAEQDGVDKVLRVITVQQGPGEVMVALKLHFESTLDSPGIARVINEFENRLRKKRPEVKWCFVEPDIDRPVVASSG
jgi:divalent metal cation (Fe/Co/Zn/Cd) transporter